MKNNDTQQQMNTPNPNLQLNNYGPAQPVPVAYQAPVQPMPIIIQQGTPQPNVVVIEEKRDIFYKMYNLRKDEMIEHGFDESKIEEIFKKYQIPVFIDDKSKSYRNDDYLNY